MASLADKLQGRSGSVFFRVEKIRTILTEAVCYLATLVLSLTRSWRGCCRHAEVVLSGARLEVRLKSMLKEELNVKLNVRLWCRIDGLSGGL